MRILVVDDEQPLRELLAQLCSREGHDVAQAGSAGEALAVLRERTCDLLITDIVMPDLDGLALIRRARALQPEIMSIAITGYGGHYTLEEILDAGASDLILKPFRAPELRVRLKLAEDQRRTLRSLKAEGRALQTTASETIDGLQRELNEARQTVARLVDVVTRGDRTL
jgi:DNA-binding response OmpR family regulator